MKSYLTASLLISLFAMSPLHAHEVYSGGKTTTKKEGANAFSMPATNLPMTKRLDFSVGNSFFRNPWVPAPASTDARDGLGPLFNTNGCQNCHIKDGRGHAPEAGDKHAVSMLVRLSIPAETAAQRQAFIRDGGIPEPTYGGQLQDFALQGVKPEGKVNISYTEVPVKFDDGTVVSLRKPSLTITELAFGDMHPKTEFSARVAPPMIGLGLLESIPEKTILGFIEQQKSENLGVSGKANKVLDVQTNELTLGRFGWKAGQPNLMQQNAAAFNGDLGLTSNLFPNENCTANQSTCSDFPNGGSPEVSDNILDFVEFYSQHLAVPIRRNVDNPQVVQGKQLFKDIGCQSCHQAEIRTAERADLPALSKQLISPYTDMLLHDMGEGLADNRPEYLANGQEWRTTPLWGLGYTKEVNGHTFLLHDGRARNIMEAILWHGGEAQNAKQKVLSLNAKEREALVAFLESL
ncbi:di-heme oxidoreductase family protein [Vibrio gallaecicus]|uniref:Di-heme oxidoredictase family protein n=1 Tax=Vibrio gallaecicus TaxID=552386 RepID=A0ABV4NCI5_9VIBR